MEPSYDTESDSSEHQARSDAPAAGDGARKTQSILIDDGSDKEPLARHRREVANEVGEKWAKTMATPPPTSAPAKPAKSTQQQQPAANTAAAPPTTTAGSRGDAKQAEGDEEAADNTGLESDASVIPVSRSKSQRKTKGKPTSAGTGRGRGGKPVEGQMRRRRTTAGVHKREDHDDDDEEDDDDDDENKEETKPSAVVVRGEDRTQVKKESQEVRGRNRKAKTEQSEVQDEGEETRDAGKKPPPMSEWKDHHTAILNYAIQRVVAGHMNEIYTFAPELEAWKAKGRTNKKVFQLLSAAWGGVEAKVRLRQEGDDEVQDPNKRAKKDE
ncbi:hypothetical protein ACQY0O_000869 [Thecaphora frezii]